MLHTPAHAPIHEETVADGYATKLKITLNTEANILQEKLMFRSSGLRLWGTRPVYMKVVRII